MKAQSIHSVQLFNQFILIIEDGLHYPLTYGLESQHSIGLVGVVKNNHVIVLKKFQLYSLLDIQLLLSEYILNTLMVVKYIYIDTKKYCLNIFKASTTGC